MNPPPNSISLTLPVSQAIDRVKELLFQPFDLNRWLVIGFCAWLATLGEGSFNAFNWTSSPNGGNHNFNDAWNEMGEFISENYPWLIPVVLLGVAVVVVVGLLITWLSSRGHFMFLDNIATGRAEVAAPWKNYRQHGNSLFLFRVLLAVVGLVLFLPLIAAVIVAVVSMVRREELTAGAMLVTLGAGGVTLILGLAFGIVHKLTHDFVVPIMWLRTPSWRVACREFSTLLFANLGHFILYILFSIVVSIVIGVIVIAIVICTCCIAGCIFAIPYLGTVLALPLLAFMRFFSVCYLAQFSREHDVFRPAAIAPL